MANFLISHTIFECMDRKVVVHQFLSTITHSILASDLFVPILAPALTFMTLITLQQVKRQIQTHFLISFIYLQHGFQTWAISLAVFYQRRALLHSSNSLEMIWRHPHEGKVVKHVQNSNDRATYLCHSFEADKNSFKGYKTFWRLLCRCHSSTSARPVRRHQVIKNKCF